MRDALKAEDIQSPVPDTSARIEAVRATSGQIAWNDMTAAQKDAVLEALAVRFGLALPSAQPPPRRPR